MADYGYFGKGAEGYAHYTQTFNSTFPSSGSGRSSYHSGKPTRTDLAIEMANERRAELDKQAAAQKQSKQKATYNKDDYSDPDLTSATVNALFAVGMFALAVAIFMAIFLSI